MNLKENRINSEIKRKKEYYKHLRRLRKTCQELGASREWVRVNKRLSATRMELKALNEELKSVGVA